MRHYQEFSQLEQLIIKKEQFNRRGDTIYGGQATVTLVDNDTTVIRRPCLIEFNQGNRQFAEFDYTTWVHFQLNRHVISPNSSISGFVPQIHKAGSVQAKDPYSEKTLEVPYQIMDSAAGTIARDAIKETVLQSDFFQVIKNTAQGLAACHETGILHRDFKPENLQINPNTQQITLLDIGSMRVPGVPDAYKNSIAPLTFQYFPPQMHQLLRRHPDAKWFLNSQFQDIYAFAVSVKELIQERKKRTDIQPFDPTIVRRLEAVCNAYSHLGYLHDHKSTMQNFLEHIERIESGAVIRIAHYDNQNRGGFSRKTIHLGDLNFEQKRRVHVYNQYDPKRPKTIHLNIPRQRRMPEKKKKRSWFAPLAITAMALVVGYTQFCNGPSSPHPTPPLAKLHCFAPHAHKFYPTERNLHLHCEDKMDYYKQAVPSREEVNACVTAFKQVNPQVTGNILEPNKIYRDIEPVPCSHTK